MNVDVEKSVVVTVKLSQEEAVLLRKLLGRLSLTNVREMMSGQYDDLAEKALDLTSDIFDGLYEGGI